MRYNITGEPMPVVICDVEANESMITEKGSMCWMSPQHDHGDQRWRHRQSLWPDVLLGVHVPEHLHH